MTVRAHFQTCRVPPTVCLSVSFCLSPVPRTLTHFNCFSFFCLTSPFPPVMDVLMCFSCWAPSCSSGCVVSKLCWNLTSRPSGDDTPDESHNQYLPLFLSSLSFLKFLSLIVFPPSPWGELFTSAPSPSALVRQCSGSARGPASSRSLRYGFLQPPRLYYRLAGVTNGGQPSKPTGGGRRPGDGDAACLCWRTQAHHD